MAARNIESIFRLTPLQEGLLFHTLEASTPGAYFDQFSVTLLGPIDTNRFAQAWQDTAAQHAVLRTFFTWEKRDHPLQVVRAAATVPFQVDDISTLDEVAQSQQIESYLDSDREQGFVLDQAPLMRVRCFTLGSDRTRMVWSFHHLILDGWSVRLLLAEVQQRYDAAGLTRFSARAAPSFEQFVSWQQTQDAESARQYWRDYLKGQATPTTLRLFVSQTDETAQTGAEQTSVQLPGEFGQRLSDFARQHRVTLNTLFVAAWGLVLSRYNDTEDVVFGTTSAGRPPELNGIEGTAGLFISTVPLRLNISQSNSVSALLSTIQRDQAHQRDHDHIGLAAIQRCSEVPAGIPLFDTLLVFENFPAFEQDSPHAFSWSEERFSEYSHYPFALLVVPGSRIELIAVHQRNTYSRTQVNRVLDSVVTALEGLLSGLPASEVDCLDRQHTERLLALGSGPAHTFAATSVVEQFEQTVRRNPNGCAVRSGGRQYSYGTLRRMVDALLDRLHGDHTDACAHVIYCPRDQSAITAQLASLKAGTVYVTLDARDPASRVDFVLDDLMRSGVGGESKGSPVLITTTELASTLDGLNSPHQMLHIDDVLRVGSVQEGVGTEGTARPVVRGVSPADPAYVIYTSGSTGQPKGVLVSHGSLVNSTAAREPFYQEAPTAFALLSSLATDSSIAGVFWTLTTGGTLVMPAERAELDVSALIDLFVTEQVSHTLCVPSLYGLMLDTMESTRLPDLRAVIVAGEACPGSLVSRHAAVLSDVRLYNEYGPSEACVWVTGVELNPHDSRVSIGSPISNTTVAIVDRQARRSPLGVAGELWVSGANLADAYVNRPEANRERFVDLESTEPRRWYRTGDKAVMADDGRLYYLGRIDHQLKVRGFRIEPGEVEAALCQYEQVDAAVVLVDDSDLESQLKALAATVCSDRPDVLENILTGVESMEPDEVERALTDLAQVANNASESF